MNTQPFALATFLQAAAPPPAAVLVAEAVAAHRAGGPLEPRWQQVVASFTAAPPDVAAAAIRVLQGEVR